MMEMRKARWRKMHGGWSNKAGMQPVGNILAFTVRVCVFVCMKRKSETEGAHNLLCVCVCVCVCVCMCLCVHAHKCALVSPPSEYVSVP